MDQRHVIGWLGALRAGTLAVLSIICLAAPTSAHAWDATRDSGSAPLSLLVSDFRKMTPVDPAATSPVFRLRAGRNRFGRRSGRSHLVAVAAAPKRPALPPSKGKVLPVTLAGVVQPRTIEYPQATGATIGDSWDFVQNKRLYSQCVQYGAVATDKYQTATMDYKQVVDEETLSVALNINTSAEAQGGFDGISANASSKLDLKTSYRTASKDQIVVAHASVVNGSSYITAQGNPVGAPLSDGAGVRLASTSELKGVTLNPKARKILEEGDDKLDFRSVCGDGFIASIGTGADLYILYHFTHLEHQVTVKLITSMEAGGGMTGVFSGKGSFGTDMSFDDLAKHDQIGIYYVQNGGQIGALPTALEKVDERVAALPKEAFEHGRPLFIVAVPYSALPDWNQSWSPSVPTALRIKLTRYLVRLRSAFTEALAVMQDYKTHAANLTGADYLHDAAHRLRALDTAALSARIYDEEQAVQLDIAQLDTTCPFKIHEVISPECESVLDAVAKVDTNDFRFLIAMPPPRNAFPKDELAQVLDTKRDRDDRHFLLDLTLYRHWIERLDRQRCELFDECLTHDERVKQLAAISALDLP